MNAEKHVPFAVAIREGLSDGGRPLSAPRLLLEAAKSLVGASVHTTPALLLAAVEELPARLCPGMNADMLRMADAVKAKLHKRLEHDCVLVLPTLPYLAPLHGTTRYIRYSRTPFIHSHTSLRICLMMAARL